jgi:hypothetical protein
LAPVLLLSNRERLPMGPVGVLAFFVADGRLAASGELSLTGMLMRRGHRLADSILAQFSPTTDQSRAVIDWTACGADR